MAGGQMLAVSSAPQVLEGERQPGVVVLIEFATAEQRRHWLASPGYQLARKVRHQAARTNLILLSGNETQSA